MNPWVSESLANLIAGLAIAAHRLGFQGEGPIALRHCSYVGRVLAEAERLHDYGFEAPDLQRVAHRELGDEAHYLLDFLDRL
eukprot:10271316-Alexandrium_andersonii.AAC.1